MKKVISLTLIVTLLLSLNIGVFAENVSTEKATVLQMKRQAFLEEFSSLNIVEMSDLDPDDPDFWFILEDDRDYVMGYGDNNPDPNFVPNENKVGIIENNMARTTANTTYKIYNSNNTLKYNSAYDNLFKAVNLASGEGNYVKEVDTGDVVFIRDNNPSTYFRFQFTNYYDDAWAVALTPQQWVNGYRYAHVIDGTGNIIANSYYLIGGIAPASYALEPESGSYYYKFSNGWSADSCSNTVDFSNVSYKINLSNNNLYIYTAAQTSTQTIELGIMCSRESQGRWWHYYRDATSEWKMKVFKNRYAVSPTNSNNTTYTYSFGSGTTLNLKLSLTDSDETLTGYIGGTAYELSGSSFSTDNNCTFIQAVSLPEAIPEELSDTQTPDLRCDSYLRNVKFTNCRLYSGVEYTGTSYNFYPNNSTIINTAFIYCDDTITYSRTSTDVETINIDYSVGYSS